ncbi:MAG: hypothetical protein ACW99U_21005 [Candidatus Thorarchaeota archaeon]|jgi:hypothetical protein
MNSTEYDSGVWDGSSVVLDLDSLDVGIYFFTIRVNDTVGHFAEDTVLVTVTEGGLFGPIDMQTLLLIVIGVLAVVIVILVIRRKKK